MEERPVGQSERSCQCQEVSFDLLKAPGTKFDCEMFEFSGEKRRLPELDEEKEPEVEAKSKNSKKGNKNKKNKKK